MKYRIFTDGSCSPNPGPGGWAAYILGLDKLISGGQRSATNNEMELTAVLNALAEVPDGSDVVVNTDSKIVIGWLCKGWKARTNPRIGQLRTAINTLVSAKKLGVTFSKVQAHSGVQYNEKVDREARRQAKLAVDLPIPEDKSFVRLTLDIYGVEMDDLLRGIEHTGGEIYGIAEKMGYDRDGDLKIVKTVGFGQAR